MTENRLISAAYIKRVSLVLMYLTNIVLKLICPFVTKLFGFPFGDNLICLHFLLINMFTLFIIKLI